ncbi:MAG: methylated-DNA--[protein]-cysteine S-methyltransferase [Propionibacteriaceae bacterium]|jgi:methylated-DNA-[protein]-cysteine S-methyltransferase|nr:methylated-DNA--[protein]-cysteine S-methyltransferase [Propionibacteriaceae bacterium]
MSIFSARFETPLGPVLAAANHGAIVGLWFLDQRYFPPAASDWTERPGDAALRRLGSWLDAYFAGQSPAPDFPLAPPGTPFRQAVWSLLRQIPYGWTATYGDLARRLGAPGRPASARAVGGAVGHNPISLVIPCHRVIGADGGLTGYAGGLKRKTALLDLEGARPPLL